MKCVTMLHMNKTMVFSIRALRETKLKLKILSAAKNTTVSKLLEGMVDRVWEEEGDNLGSQKLMHTAGKEIRKLFKDI